MEKTSLLNFNDWNRLGRIPLVFVWKYVEQIQMQQSKYVGIVKKIRGNQDISLRIKEMDKTKGGTSNSNWPKQTMHQ